MAESIITVGKTEKDQWGNLIVTTTQNQKVKIAQKREILFPLFQQGKTISLDYQTYMDKPYVADAKEVAGEAVKEIRTPADLLKEGKLIPKGGKSEPPKPQEPEIAPQELRWKHKAFALSYAKDLVCAGAIDKDEMYKSAQQMLDWLNKLMV